MADEPTDRKRTGQPGIRARLAREDPHEMTAAARASGNHPSSLERWRRIAREQNPGATGNEIELAAIGLRRDFYREMNARSAEVRRTHGAARRTAGEVSPERQQAGRTGIQARLAREDPREMTAAANASSSHPRSLARWEQAAREQHPGAADDEVTQIAARLRSEYFRQLGRRSWRARRASAAAS